MIKKQSEAIRALPPEVLLSRRQVAKRWGVCVHTVARNRNLQPIRLNARLLRYRLSDVEAAEQEGR